jgi:hypothetical protein
MNEAVIWVYRDLLSRWISAVRKGDGDLQEKIYKTLKDLGDLYPKELEEWTKEKKWPTP